MPNPDPILAAVAAYCAGPTLPTSGDLAAAAIRATVAELVPIDTNLRQCLIRARLLDRAALLDGRDD